MLNHLKVLLAGIGITTAFAFMVLMVFLGGIALHYDVTFWAHYFHHPVHGNQLLFWVACLVGGFFFGRVAIVVAVITFILSFFL